MNRTAKLIGMAFSLGFVAIVTLSAIGLLGGCASPQAGLESQGATAEQIRAAALDRNAAVGCSTVEAALTKTTIVYVMLDKGAVPRFDLTVGDGCAVKLKAGQPLGQ